MRFERYVGQGTVLSPSELTWAPWACELPPGMGVRAVVRVSVVLTALTPSVRAQVHPGHTAGLLARTATARRRAHPAPHPTTDGIFARSSVTLPQDTWARTDLWARERIEDWLRVTGPRPWTWATVGLGTAGVGTAVLLSGFTHGFGDTLAAPGGHLDLVSSSALLGGGCANLCGLALTAGASALTGGVMQLLSPNSHTVSESYARAFVATQSGLWVLGVMGSL